MEKHPSVVRILRENKGTPDRIEVVTKLMQNGWPAEMAYEEINSCIKDRVIKERIFGITVQLILI